MTQIHISVLVGLIEGRLAEREAGIQRGLNATQANVFDMYGNRTYRETVKEEIAFLRALLHEIEYPLPGAAR